MRLFKTKIPKEDIQEVSVLESWSVIWYIKTGWSNATERQAKVFIKIEDAEAFKIQLLSSADFIGCWIDVKLELN
jgi:hypothetical protein